MGLSQIGTKILLPAMTAMLTFTSFAFAQNNLNSGRNSNEIQARLQALYANKNRPFPTHLTVDASAVTDLKKAAATATAAKNTQLNSSKNAIRMGGVSDGGGNAIRGKLFDFAENDGSLLISIQDLLDLEPRTQQILNRLNHEIPAIRNVNGQALGDAMVTALKGKRIYLESKEIVSAACRNQSMVESHLQKVVACQSKTELRISVAWLMSPETDSSNRAGLFTHEMGLALIRNFSPDENKEQKEESVRVLNRAIFEGEPLAPVLKKELAIKGYTQELRQQAFYFQKKVPQVLAQFCVNAENNSIQDVTPVLSNPDVAAEISSQSIGLVREIIASNGNQTAINKIQQSRKCEDARLDAIPARKANYSAMTSECLRHMKKVAFEDAELFLAKGVDLDESTYRYLKGQGMSGVKATANMCAGLKGIELQKQPFMTEEKGKKLMNEAYIESLIYYREIQQAYGIDYKFSADSIEE